MPRKSCLTSASLLEVDLSKKPLTSIYGTILTLKSQMACNVARQVSGAYKTLQSQIDKRESEWQFLDFDPTSATFSFERDFGLSGDTLSITTLAGRRRYKILNYQYAQRYLDGSWKYLASKLCLHKNGAYFFHLACAKDIPDKNIVDASTFMGVDVGINCLAVASTTDKWTAPLIMDK